MTYSLKNNSITNLLVLIFWIFLIFLFLNELFMKPSYNNIDTFDDVQPIVPSLIIPRVVKPTKITVYNFNTNWCGYSKKFQPIWDRFVDSIATNSNIVALDMKCDNNQNADLVKKYSVEGFPTVIIDDGKSFIIYKGNRTVNDLRKALNLDPIVDNTKEAVIPSTFGCGNNNKPKNDKVIVYNFNTLWCGHSKNFQPIWDKLVESIPKDSNIILVDVKCDDGQNSDLVKEFEVRGFPTIVKVMGDAYAHYTGERSVNAIRQALDLPEISTEKTEKIVRFKDNEKTIYNFNTAWCGYSVRFQSIWDEFSKIVANTNVNAIDVKCEKPENKELCGKYKVPGYPSVVLVTSDDEVVNYEGPRTVEALLAFVHK